jgi:hypothetical protein
MALQKKVKKTRKLKEKDIDLDHDEPSFEDIDKAMREIGERDMMFDADYYPEDDQ